MGRYLAYPLSVQCNSLADLQKFLMGCQYVSDKE
jgi:hypothetical protein